MGRILLCLFVLTATLFTNCNRTEHPDAPVYVNEKFPTPESIYGDFYREMMMVEFIPNEEFADAIPKRSTRDILNDYRRAKNDRDFDSDKFLEENFTLPSRDYTSPLDSNTTIDVAIEILWKHWERPGQAKSNAAYDPLIALPNAYLTHSDGTEEQKYWESYFIMLGCASRGEWTMVTNMMDNFTHMIDQVGHIPMANRSYDVSKSHYPAFLDMVLLLYQHDQGSLDKYGPYVEKEYMYWMKGMENLTDDTGTSLHVVKQDGKILNRFWDENVTPRPRLYESDSEAEQNSDYKAGWEKLRDIRTSEESGWNFTARYFDEPRSWWHKITSKVLPIDLNSTLLEYERFLADFYSGKNEEKQALYDSRYKARLAAIEEVFWNEEAGCYFDYRLKDSTLTSVISVATLMPMYNETASREKADKMADLVKEKLLEDGGVMSTDYESWQRWDAPRAWPHLQWYSYHALKNYGYDEWAEEIRTRWISTIEEVFETSKTFRNYYDVKDLDKNMEDGDFLKTNHAATVGVYLAFKAME